MAVEGDDRPSQHESGDRPQMEKLEPYRQCIQNLLRWKRSVIGQWRQR
ncbi:MAG: hypothetical protein HC899_32115 [Leptolyngbyaceae cyanobacterium SM1_4_3]|nr:hypothetical protein [Leptolyngbyaceae cyanobacterium SM1_4_3]